MKGPTRYRVVVLTSFHCLKHESAALETVSSDFHCLGVGRMLQAHKESSPIRYWRSIDEE